MTDWQVGDLALLIRDLETIWGSRAGQVFVVEAVIPDVLWEDDLVDDALRMVGIIHENPCGGSWQGNFRKITPGADIEGVEAEKRRHVPSKHRDRV